MTAPRSFQRVELVRLWLSYQRYAFAIILANLIMFASVVALAGIWIVAWCSLLVAIPIAVASARFAFEVLRAHPRKLRATWAHQRRHAAGRFNPDALRSYCGDPCWRIVAHEILRRSGHSPAERSTIVRRLAREFADERHATVVIDHVSGIVRRTSPDGESLTFHLPASPTPIETGTSP